MMQHGNHQNFPINTLPLCLYDFMLALLDSFVKKSVSVTRLESLWFRLNKPNYRCKNTINTTSKSATSNSCGLI